MLADALRALYAYNHWATERVLDTADRLTPEQLDAPGTAGRGSIRETLLHQVHTQRGWLGWWNGSMTALEGYSLPIDPSKYPDLAAVRAFWEQVEAETQRFLDGLTDAEAAREYAAEELHFRMQLFKMMLHVANHGTQHRSEVAAMLTAAGHSPGDLDAVGYFWLGAGESS